MKNLEWTGAGILILLLGATPPAFAQGQPGRPERHEEGNKGHAAPQGGGRQELREQPHPAMRQQEGRPNRPEQPRPGPQRPEPRPAPQRPEPRPIQHRPEPRPVQHRPEPPRPVQHRPEPPRPLQHRPEAQRPEQRRQEAVHRNIWGGHRAGNWQSEHRDWRQRGGYQGTRIPERRYHGSFGPEHGFRLSTFALSEHGGHPRFRYGGYWLSVVDPWPEDWSSSWYGDDDVYIDASSDGYYMVNRNHPLDRIAVSISLN
jgi:hypothetical protein